VKPAPFAYARASGLAEVLDVLEREGEHCRLLAGGQSLLPALNLRLAAPPLLLDISGLPELRGIAALPGGGVRLGALTRHAELESDPLVAARAPLLARAAPLIAHPAIRNRGTLGGSLALADPAAELPACMLALEATILAHSRRGERRIPASEFFRGLYTTALAADEVLAAVEIPPPGPGEGSVILELARRHGDYAIVGVAAVGRRRSARLAFFGVGATAMRARAAEAALAEGVAAAQAALAADLDPPADLHGPPALRLHLARVLLGRALSQLPE
jgi:carbon-monoxide dehydrogenase medium subunit